MKQLRMWCVGISALVLLTWPAPGYAISAAERLERGVYQEETAGNLDAAIQEYAILVREEQTNRPLVAEALYRLGKCYAKRGDPAKARQTFDDLVRRFPDQKKHTALARKELASLPAPSAGPVSAEVKAKAEKMSAEAWQLWQQRKLPAAEALFKQSLELDATNPNSWNGYGWSLSNQGKHAEAMRAFDSGIRLEAKHPAILNGLGWSSYALGKKDEAVTWWQKSVEAAPNATAAWNGLVTVYTERKEYGQAVQALNKWLEVEPQNAEAKAQLARVQALAGASQNQPQASPQAQSVSPAAPGASQLIGKVEERMKSLEQIQAGGNSYWLDKKDIADLYTDWAKAGATEAQKKAEIAAIQDYLGRHAQNPLYGWRVNHLLAVASMDIGQVDKAEQFYKAALDTYPGTKYDEPSKQSKYQHLVNEHARIIWQQQGVEAAEKYALEKLASDPKLDFLFTSWWENEYREKGLAQRAPAFAAQVEAGYRQRKTNFPAKAQMIDRTLAQITATAQPRP